MFTGKGNAFKEESFWPKDEVISKLFNVFGNIESCRGTTISNITK